MQMQDVSLLFPGHVEEREDFQNQGTRLFKRTVTVIVTPLHQLYLFNADINEGKQTNRDRTTASKAMLARGGADVNETMLAR